MKTGRPRDYRDKRRLTVSLEADLIEALDRLCVVLRKKSRTEVINHILEERIPQIDADYIERRLQENLAEREELYALKERAKHVGINVPDELAERLAKRRQMIQTSFRPDDPQIRRLNESWLQAQGVPAKDRERLLVLLQP